MNRSRLCREGSRRVLTQTSASFERSFRGRTVADIGALTSAGALTRISWPDNRARRLGGLAGRLSRGVAVALAAAAVSGCSLSFPIAGFKADSTSTGSIDGAGVFLSPALDREDLRRAKAALSVALDPQGNGQRVNWQNPQSGAKGAFAASAPPFTEHDRVCRAFAADVAAGTGAERHLSGSACRDGDGTWQLRPSGKA